MYFEIRKVSPSEIADVFEGHTYNEDYLKEYMHKKEDILCFDFQGWPMYKMNWKEIIEAIGGKLNEDGTEWTIPNTEKLDIYPRTLEEDGMGYGINEKYVTEVLIRDDYSNIFIEEKRENPEQ